MNSEKFSRVVCCQGTIQLAVAIHTLQYRESRKLTANNPVFKNYLIVHDLFTAQNQERQFYEVIRRMAESVLQWESIIYLDASSIDQLDALLIEKGRYAFDKQIGEKLGIAHVDEIYISRNWQKGSMMLLNTFSNAFKICYGDSIGLYFPESYFSNKDWKTRFRLSGAGQWLSVNKNTLQTIVKYPGRKPLFNILRPQKFDYGYFCFPSIAGDEPDFKYEVMPVSNLKNTFEKFVDSASLDVPQELDLSGKLTVLLTSNFSEASRMSLSAELDSYVQFVRAHEKEKGVLLIKPHPRDSKEKIELLKTRFTEESYSVFVLDDPTHFYIPFEFFLIKFEKTNPGIIQKIEFFTVSSACLSFWFLFGVKPHIGPGPQLVKKYFQVDQVAGRLQHEMDLQELMESTSSLLAQ